MSEKEIIFGNSFLAIPLELGSALGNFDEAVFIQFIHRWCLNAKKNERSYNFKEGYYWTYMTYKEMEEQLPMFSESKIKRMIKSLKDKDYIVVDKFNKKKYDRTNWYRVNYDVLQRVLDHWVKLNYPLGQNELMDEVKTNQPIPKSSTKSSTKSIKRYSVSENGGVFKLYEEIYKERKQKQHPTVTKDQLNDLKERLDAVIDDLNIDADIDTITELINMHFYGVPSDKERHISGFIGHVRNSPLYRYYDEFLELPF